VIYHPATTWLPTNRWEPGAIYRVEVAGVSPYGLHESVVWVGLDRGNPDQPDHAPVQAPPGATVDAARQAIQLAVLQTG
jgi:hypothetical protein